MGIGCMLYSGLPKSVDEAVEIIISELPLNDRVYIAGLKRDELGAVTNAFRSHIEQDFGMLGINRELVQSCRDTSGIDDLNPRRGVEIVVEALWRELQKTHKMRLLSRDED